MTENPFDPYNQQPQRSTKEDKPSSEPAPEQNTQQPTEPTQQPKKKSALFEELMASKKKISEKGGIMNFFEEAASPELKKLAEDGFGVAGMMEGLFGEVSELMGDSLPEPLKELLGIGGMAELQETTEDVDTTAVQETTETGVFNEAQARNAAEQASSTINTPSVGNQGVIRGESSASQPKAAGENFVQNMIVELNNPPANRTGSM